MSGTVGENEIVPRCARFEALREIVEPRSRLRPARVAEEDDRGALNESFRSRGWLLTHGKVTLYEREER